MLFLTSSAWRVRLWLFSAKGLAKLELVRSVCPVPLPLEVLLTGSKRCGALTRSVVSMYSPISGGIEGQKRDRSDKRESERRREWNWDRGCEKFEFGVWRGDGVAKQIGEDPESRKFSAKQSATGAWQKTRRQALNTVQADRMKNRAGYLMGVKQTVQNKRQQCCGKDTPPSDI